MRTLILVGLLAVGIAACAPTARMVDDVITVEGEVSVRGSEPFTAVWLETDDANSYVLVTASTEQADGFLSSGRYRVTGAVYRDEWNGFSVAHLRVRRFERITED